MPKAITISKLRKVAQRIFLISSLTASKSFSVMAPLVSRSMKVTSKLIQNAHAFIKSGKTEAFFNKKAVQFCKRFNPINTSATAAKVATAAAATAVAAAVVSSNDA
jgi:hypothetical protein